MRLTADKVLEKIHRCAVLYKDNLLGKNILFVASDKSSMSMFEAIFLARNFLHFTGVGSNLKSTMFFNAALHNKLNRRDITISSGGLTELKLDVLPTLMSIHIIARMVGNYDNSKSLLVTDKFAGTHTAVMGFKEDGGYFYPNTVLNEDLRNLTVSPRQRVVATFVKIRKDLVYTELSYIAKGIFVEDIYPTVKHKVDIENIIAAFDIPRK